MVELADRAGDLPGEEGNEEPRKHFVAGEPWRERWWLGALARALLADVAVRLVNNFSAW